MCVCVYQLYKHVWASGFHPVHDGIERPAVLSLLPQRIYWMGKRMLDIGCGAGNLCRQMRSAHASSVVGLDPSMRMLAVARAKEVQDEHTARGLLCDPTAMAGAPKQRSSVSGMFKKLFGNEEGGHEQVSAPPLPHACGVANARLRGR